MLLSPSQYLPCNVTVQEREAPSQNLHFGSDLKGAPISCLPKALYSVKVTHPSIQAYIDARREPSPKAGTEESGIFYEVDSETFVRARDRALKSQGALGHDVFRRPPAEYDAMEAKLYVNETGEGGLGAWILPDGRVEAIGAFNMRKTAENPDRISMDVARRGIMKLRKINTAECLQNLAAQRLELYGYKTVAKVPIKERMPPDWPQQRQDENLHSLVLIPSRPPSPDTLDKPPVECKTLEEYYQAGKDAHEEMYKNYK